MRRLERYSPRVNDFPLDERHVVTGHGEKTNEGAPVVARETLGGLKEVCNAVVVVPLVVQLFEIRLKEENLGLSSY